MEALFQAPTRDREVLTYPKGGLGGIIRQNALRLESFGPGRRALKEELGLSGAPLIVTGHQPVTYYPGLLAKEFFAVRAAALTGGRAVNIVLDTDEAEKEEIYYPSAAGGIVSVNKLRPAGGGLFFDIKPDRAAMLELAAGIEKSIRSCLGENSLSSLSLYRRALEASFPGSSNLSLLNTASRSRFLGGLTAGLLHLPLSRLAGTGAFDKFFKHIASRAGEFHRIYNASLAAYRKREGISHPLTPFPDLGDDELPFWIYENGRRKTCVHPVPEAEARVFPKAVTLTMFARLYLADIWINGAGGGNYDMVTDMIIKEFFGVEPPVYKVVSACMHIREYAVPDDAEIKKTQGELRRLEHSPHLRIKKIFPQDSDPYRLSLLKEKVTAELNAAGEGRRELQKKSEELNGLLSPYLEKERRVLSDRLAGLESAKSAAAAWSFRKYPYFIYPAEKISELFRLTAENCSI